MSAQLDRLKKLKEFAADRGPKAGLLAFMEAPSIASAAEVLGMPRPDLSALLSSAEGRSYPHWRRHIEQALNLPPYSLDEVLDDGPFS